MFAISTPQQCSSPSITPLLSIDQWHDFSVKYDGSEDLKQELKHYKNLMHNEQLLKPILSNHLSILAEKDQMIQELEDKLHSNSESNRSLKSENIVIKQHNYKLKFKNYAMNYVHCKM